MTPTTTSTVRVADDDKTKSVHLHARLMKLHGAEKWAERYGAGIDGRAVLAGLILAFSMQNIVSMEENKWNSRGMFEAYGVLQAVSTGLALFAVIVYSTISAVIARQLGRTECSYGPDAATAIEHIGLVALMKTHGNPNPWFEPGGEEMTTSTDVVATALELESTLESLQPCAANWLNARSRVKGKEGKRSTPRFVPTPRKLGKWAQWAFILALSCYFGCMALKLADVLGVMYGIFLGLMMGASLASAIVLLALNDGFDIN